MATKITLPQLGESVHEGTIGQWLKKVAIRSRIRAYCGNYYGQGKRGSARADFRHPYFDTGKGRRDGRGGGVAWRDERGRSGGAGWEGG